jgi:hypothetical protein
MAATGTVALSWPFSPKRMQILRPLTSKAGPSLPHSKFGQICITQQPHSYKNDLSVISIPNP